MVESGMCSEQMQLFHGTLSPCHSQFGRSLLEVIADRDKKIRDFVTCEGGRNPEERHCDEFHAGGPKGTSKFSPYYPRHFAQVDDDAHARGYMVRTDKFKLVSRVNGKNEFYDLVVDPKEKINEINNSMCEKEKHDLEKKLCMWLMQTADVVPYDYDKRFSDEMIWDMKSMVMADGPAGLRLSKKYYKDESGVHSIGSDLPESFLDYIGEDNIKKLQEMMKKNVPADESEIKEQYATAIPIGTAIAQSFNCELAGTYGDIVGDEMERFGVQLWLAPALNIHRSIFCGRNFEYYSEDPLVSGLMAASITEGVQKHKGCGTTIKHYAANNAETNRYFNNSKVSERAMREIYLRGFGICVRKAKPCALMTSYNLLNGIHTSEHRGLIEDILRCEFGFDGIVMTDWVVEWVQSLGKEHRNATITEVAKAGGDVFMPGVKNDFERLLKGISDGSVPRKQVQQNVTRIYRMAEKLSQIK